MKNTFYFTHDYNARLDEKIKKLLSKHGFLGYGLFWALIEDLYNNTNVLRLDYDTISFDLRCNVDIVKSIINDFDLFILDGENFGSLSVQKRLDERKKISEKARSSVLKRWKNKDFDTVVLQSNNDSNTRKGKERKEKERKIKEKKIEIIESVFLTENEIFKAKEFYLQNYNEAISILSNYKLSSGKKYKSDYHALIGWVADRIKQKINSENGNNKQNAGNRSKIDTIVEGAERTLKLIQDGNL